MPWLQVSFTVERRQAPLMEAALETAGALAVTLSDAGDDPQLEPQPGTTPLWEGVRVQALFEADADSRARLEALAASLGPQVQCAPVIEEVADRAWERVWLEDLRPTRFGRRLWICPQGQHAPDPQGIVVDLDPGLAFGTGHHATTALCLEWLDGAELRGRSLVDYGCGSGILAIAALKLGAAHAIAVDHDPQALEATGSNAERNRVAGRLSLCRPGELHGHRLPVDLVVANILAGPLIELAPVLLGLVRPGGLLVLSGVLAGQIPAVSAAYANAVVLEPARLKEDWALIWGRKRDPDAPPPGD